MATLSNHLRTCSSIGIAVRSEASRKLHSVSCGSNIPIVGVQKQLQLQRWQNVKSSKAVTGHRRSRTLVVRNAAEQKSESSDVGAFLGQRSLWTAHVMSYAESKTEDEVVDGYVNQYCDLKKGKRSMGEMEQDFLLALQSFYINEAPIMSNEEFDNLKEELLWEGSKVVVLSAEEQKFMEACLAYQAGKPFLTDKEFDELKVELKKQSSKVAIEGPRCSIRSKKVYSDTTVDYLRMTLLNLPAALVALGVVFFLDDLTGFEITFLLELPEPYSFIFTWFVVLPTTYLIAQTITNFVLSDFLILNGPCPNCGAKTVSFFGTILTVANTSRVNDVKCEAMLFLEAYCMGGKLPLYFWHKPLTSCGSLLKVDLDKRMITLEQQPAAAPAKA